jgi:hypothetical protein
MCCTDGDLNREHGKTEKHLHSAEHQLESSGKNRLFHILQVQCIDYSIVDYFIIANESVLFDVPQAVS